MRNFWSTNKRNDLLLLLLQEQGRSSVHSLPIPLHYFVYSHKPINNKGVVN